MVSFTHSATKSTITYINVTRPTYDGYKLFSCQVLSSSSASSCMYCLINEGLILQGISNGAGMTDAGVKLRYILIKE